MDGSTEVISISASSALKSLENVRLFLLQQEGTGEQVRFLKDFLVKNEKEQTTITNILTIIFK